MKLSSIGSESTIARGRHMRLGWYVAVSLSVTLVAYYHLGLDWQHSLGYAVAAYVLLVLANFRTVLSKVKSPVGRLEGR